MDRSRLLRRLRPLRPLLALAVVLPALATGCDTTKTTQPSPLPPLRSVVLLTPDRDTLSIGGAMQMVAVGVDSSGDTLRNLRLTWSTTDASVASVSTSGLVHGVGEGNAKIVVSRDVATPPYDTAFVFVRPALSGWIVQTSNASEDLHGVFFLSSGRTGWAVGDGGVILKTSDAGVTWTRQTPTTFNLHAVWFTATAGWAVGAAGTVLTSTDLGKTWTRVNVPQASGNQLMDVVFADANHGTIVGFGGTLLVTTDGGAHWVRFNPQVVTRLNSVAFSGTADGWVVGQSGFVFGTHDGGTSWYQVPGNEINTNNELFCVTRRSRPSTLSASSAVVVGQNGVVLRAESTTDSLAWALGNAGAVYQLNGVTLPLGQVVFAVGSNLGQGVILRSDDGGDTWTPQVASSGSLLNDVWFIDTLRGWAVGANGTIRHTATGGQP